MIDIHCHILHELDDGAEDLNESIEMARIAYENGIRHVFATPHFTSAQYQHREIIIDRVSLLQTALAEANIPIQLHAGHEVRIESVPFVMEHCSQHNFCTLGSPNNDTSKTYVLIEQRWQDYEVETPALFKWLLTQQIQPIIAHPERHYFFRKQPELLEDLIRLGAWTQVSADSLVGNNSDDVRNFCRWLLEHDHVHTIATDAHNIRRKPNLSEGFQVIEEWSDKKRVQTIQERIKTIIEH